MPAAAPHAINLEGATAMAVAAAVEMPGRGSALAVACWKLVVGGRHRVDAPDFEVASSRTLK